MNSGWVQIELSAEEVQQYASNHAVDVNIETDISKAPFIPYMSISRYLGFVYRAKNDNSGKFWSLDGLEEAVTN